jgi:putative ATP-binding cassette transporter
MGPIQGLVASIPFFIRGQASLEKLEELDVALANVTSVPTPASVIAQADGFRFSPLGTPPLVEFRNVVFRRGSENNGGGFTLGPIDLTLYPGELVFIIGGNGSGKSTLAKVITGLYPPQSGEILVEGVPVSAISEEAYRQLYSAVFSDFFLFNRQRRRMALLVAYLEDRPIYVLDEWAADQDPEFRQIFYMKLLPELKEKGKTVVVITHDDRYFHLGDRVIKLDYGKVIETLQQGVPAESLRS